MIYADHAATTAMSSVAYEAMLPWLQNRYGNPSTLYSLARDPRKAVVQSREVIANAIHANPSEIFFTSGGTEADNWALKGTLFQHERGKGIITSAIEHHAILNSCAALERMGYSIKRTILMRSATGCLSWNTSLKNCPQKNASSSAGRGRLRSSKHTGNGRIRFPVIRNLNDLAVLSLRAVADREAGVVSQINTAKTCCIGRPRPVFQRMTVQADLHVSGDDDLS